MLNVYYMFILLVIRRGRSIIGSKIYLLCSLKINDTITGGFGGDVINKPVINTYVQ